jgi:hypothetical protein
VKDLKELMSIGQYVYQELVKKEKLGELLMADLMLEVRHIARLQAAV